MDNLGIHMFIKINKVNLINKVNKTRYWTTFRFNITKGNKLNSRRSVNITITIIEVKID